MSSPGRFWSQRRDFCKEMRPHGPRPGLSPQLRNLENLRERNRGSLFNVRSQRPHLGSSQRWQGPACNSSRPVEARDVLGLEQGSPSQGQAAEGWAGMRWEGSVFRHHRCPSLCGSLDCMMSGTRHSSGGHAQPGRPPRRVRRSVGASQMS